MSRMPAALAPRGAPLHRRVAERLAARDLPGLLARRERAPRAASAAPTERVDPIFPVLGAAADGENAVPILEGFHRGSPGMWSFREGANPQ